MLYKDSWVKEHYKMLHHKNPKLMSLLLFAEGWCQETFSKDLYLTSLYRDMLDVYGMHRAWRAADLRVAHSNLSKEIYLEDFQEVILCNVLNRQFKYGRKWTLQQGKVALLRKPKEGQADTAPHIHLQVRGYGAWK